MPEKKEILEKEIDLIQACINRMAQNSFIVKGWTITLITVILALLPEKIDIRLLCAIVIVATVCFWYLDAFFLRTERLYRWKYEWVIANRPKSEEYCYDLNPYNEKMWLLDKDGKQRQAPTIRCIMFTKTLTPIYVPLVSVSGLLFILEVFPIILEFLQKKA